MIVRVLACGLGVLAAGLGRAQAPMAEQTFGFEPSAPAISLVLGQTPEGLNELSNCRAVILEQGPVPDDPVSGKRAYRLKLSFRGNGYAYPTFYLKEPLPVDGPLYLSGYLKIVEQDPESRHDLQLLAWGEYPQDPQPTLGKLSTVPTPPVPAGAKLVWKGANLVTPHSQAWKGGWQFVRTDDIHALMLARNDIRKKDGMCLFAVSVCIYGCRPGKSITLLLDDLRLSRSPPVVPPEKQAVAAALRTFRQIGPEFSRLAERDGAAGLRERNRSLYAQTAQAAGKPDLPEARATLVVAVPRLEAAFYSLKLLELAEQ